MTRSLKAVRVRAEGRETPDINSRKESQDVIELARESWQTMFLRPPTARPVLQNKRLRTMAKSIEDSGVVPGRLTVAVTAKGKQYLLDGWHRMTAFSLGSRDTALADVKYIEVRSYEDMAQLFLDINTPIRAITLNDKLRAFYGHNKQFKRLVDDLHWCGFVSGNSEKIPISTPLRAWFSSEKPVPTTPPAYILDLLPEFDTREEVHFRNFMQDAFDVWGCKNESKILWRGLNLGILMWMYRRTTVDARGNTTPLTREQWKPIFGALLNSREYLRFLAGMGMQAFILDETYKLIRGVVKKLGKVHKNKHLIFPTPSWDDAKQKREWKSRNSGKSRGGRGRVK